MPIFLIVPLLPETPLLDAAIEKKIVDQKDRYQLPHGRGWLVHFQGTTVEVSNHIGVSTPDSNVPTETEPAIVTMVMSYYGRAPRDVWEWIYTRADK